jgi:hypothetical protein
MFLNIAFCDFTTLPQNWLRCYPCRADPLSKNEIDFRTSRAICVFFILLILGCPAQFARHSQWAFNSIAVRACRCPTTQGIRWSGTARVQRYRSSCVSMSQSASNSLVCNYGRSTVSQFVRVQVSKRSTVSQSGRGDVPKLQRVVGLQVWAFNSIQLVCVEVPKLMEFVGVELWAQQYCS